MADITTIKLLLNSTIFTPNVRFLTLDIKNYYLRTSLEQYECMHLPISNIPNDIATKYNPNYLTDKDGWVYMEMRKGMYGLKQAGKLAHKLLTQHLDPYGYYKWRPTTFSLVVDDFEKILTLPIISSTY